MKRSYENNKIKILFYEPTSGFGGSSSFLANLINNLNTEKFSHFLVIKNHGPQFNRINGVETIKFRNYSEPEEMSHFGFLFFFFIYIFPEAIKIYFIIKQKGIDLVHINTSIVSGTPAIIASKLAGIPCICYIQQTKQLINRERFFANWVEQFVIQNRHCFEIYKQDIPEEKLNLIYLGLDLKQFTPSKKEVLRKEFGFGSSPLLGLIGRIVEGKGQKEFILAAKEVIKTMPEAKFVIVGDAVAGDGKYYQEVKELVMNEGLVSNIIFTGWRLDIEDVISDMDILVQASSTFPESFGLTIIEAMALSKPVVATNIPGPSEIVLNGVTGFLVPPANPEKLAEAALEILNDKTKAKNFGDAGRQRVKELFNINKIARKIQTLYEKVLGDI